MNDYNKKGKKAYSLLKELFPITRSITGNGVRKTLERIKQNIPKTLNMFRKHLKKRETKRHEPANPEKVRLLTKNTVTILKSYHAL